MALNFIQEGHGPPLLLLHGLGGTWRSWIPILGRLALKRRVCAVDLPGFGATPPLNGEISIRTLADAVAEFIAAHRLRGIDVVGSSMGGRLALELARRDTGAIGRALALAPGGFRSPKLKHLFFVLMYLSRRLTRALDPLLPVLTRNVVGRTILFAPFSMRPWKLPPEIGLDEMRHYANSQSFDDMVYDLAYGAPQLGSPAGTLTNRIVIGWGRWDLICFPSQARRAIALFPDARLEWFADVGHFPHWDSPEQTVEFILRATEPAEFSAAPIDIDESTAASAVVDD